MSQIKIQDLLPLMKPGFVAMDEDGSWYWYPKKPVVYKNRFVANWIKFPIPTRIDDTFFDIAPFEGNWKDSLVECGK